MQPRVHFAVLRQLAEHGTADRATTAAMVPGADERDLMMALENLLDDGSIEGPTTGAASLLELAAGGQLRLTALGTLRMDEGDL
jgi:hypothetical protein